MIKRPTKEELVYLNKSKTVIEFPEFTVTMSFKTKKVDRFTYLRD